jgi:hypothetical protein
MPPLSVETYENFPWLNEKEKETKKSDCKEKQTKCYYSCQGQFICELVDSDKNTAKNKDMAQLFNKPVSPWLS